MKTISRYIMTLALLLTAVTGAWAADTYTVVGNNSDMFGAAWDAYAAANDMTKNDDGTYSITYTDVPLAADVQYKVVVNRDWGKAYPADNRVITIAEAGFYTLTIHFNPTTHEVYETMPGSGSDEPTVEVTTNAASAQDLFTEASFTMPAFDATVNYMLVRDMQDEANPVTFSGLPSSGSIVVKKGSDGKYQPAEALTIQLIDPLAAAEAQNIIAADGITVKVLVGNGGTPIEYDQENPITLEAFLADMKPGYYWIKAESTDENSPYDGTVYSSEFTVVEQYDLTVKPANDFSKGKIDNVTVGSESVTIDANTGEATKNGIDPGTEVKIKAKRGYVIEKVEAKKVDPAKAYLKWNSTQKKLVATEMPATYNTVENASTNVNWQAGTYVVEGNVTINARIRLYGNVDLIIKDGAKLTVNSYINGDDKNLRIFGQAQMTGELVVNCSGPNDQAISQLPTLEVHSAKVTATASGNNRGGFINIATFNVYGGLVDAKNTGSSGFGIRINSGGSMNIYGGEVKAEGKGNGTLTGCGFAGDDSNNKATVTVYGGKIWSGSAEKTAFISVNLLKGAGFTGKIETSADNSDWAEYTGDETPDSKYVRVGY